MREALVSEMSTGWLARLSRGLLGIRLYAIGLTVLSWTAASPGRVEVAVTVAVGVLSLALVVAWPQVVPVVVRWPSLFLVDVALGLALGVVTEPLLAFAFYLMSVALLVGLLAGFVPALAVSGVLSLGAVSVLARSADEPGTLTEAQTLSLIGLFPVCALATRTVLRAVLRRLDDAGTEVRQAARDSAVTERNRIALDLHDSLGKTIEGALFSVAALQGRLVPEHPASSIVMQLGRDMRSAADQARMLMLELQHEPGSGLAPSVRSYAHRWSERSRIAMVADVPDLPPLPPLVSHGLLAMLTECLANVEAHSGSERAEISLTLSDGAAGTSVLALRVRDFGCGLPEGAGGELHVERGHLGLFGLRRRALALGGRATLATMEPGTLVTVAVPVLSAAALEGAASPMTTIDVRDEGQRCPTTVVDLTAPEAEVMR